MDKLPYSERARRLVQDLTESEREALVLTAGSALQELRTASDFESSADATLLARRMLERLGIGGQLSGTTLSIGLIWEKWASLGLDEGSRWFAADPRLLERVAVPTLPTGQVLIPTSSGKLRSADVFDIGVAVSSDFVPVVIELADERIELKVTPKEPLVYWSGASPLVQEARRTGSVAVAILRPLFLPERRAPLVTTPPVVASAVLDLADVRIGDRIVDIGCGTGEILVEAARRGLSVVGVESESERALKAEERTLGWRDSVEVIVGSAPDAVPWDREVYVCYLNPETNASLREPFVGAITRGAVVISHMWPVEGLRPADIASVDSPSYRHRIYRYDRRSLE